MSSRARKAAIDDEEWERVRPIIHQLYLVDGKTQRDTLKILSEYHNLDPSKAQLERKLKQWRMVRNMTGPEWKYVDRVIRQRQSHGKGSQLYLAGIPLRPAAIEKARSRHCYETAIAKSMPMLEPSHPEELPLIVRTPSPLGHRYMDYLEDIPWLQLLNFFKGFTLRVPRSKRGADNSLQCVGSRLLDLVPNDVQHILTHTTRLQWTYQVLYLIMPGRSQKDHISRAEAVLNQSGFGSPEALETVFFLLSNGFLNEASQHTYERSNQIIDFILELLQKSNNWAEITSQPYSELPLSLRAILDRLFMRAVETSDLKAIGLLLQAGADVNIRFIPGHMIREYRMVLLVTPFEYATILCNTSVAAFLADHGADTEFSASFLDFLPHVIDESLRGKKEVLSLIHLVLSYLVFRPECEPDIRRVLHTAEKFGKSPVPEALIDFFRGRVVAAESISQLIVTAIRTESTSVLGLLSQYPGYIDEPNLYGETPLMAAASQGDLQVCEELLQLGASLEVKPRRPMPYNIPTPLQCAAYYADARMVRCFLDAGAYIDFEHSTDALHRRHPGDLCLEQHLESAGHDVLLSSMGRTALQAALLGRNEDTAHLLLAEGAKFFGEELAISIRTGLSRLISPSWDSQTSFAKKTISSGVLKSTLEAAIIAGDHEAALRELNTSPQSITPEALYAAIWFLNSRSFYGLEFVREILQKGSGLRNSTDHWVGTAMSLAAKFGLFEVVELMLSYGLRPTSCLPTCYIEIFASNLRQSFDSGTYQTEEVYLEWLSIMLFRFMDYMKPWSMLDDAVYRGPHDYLDLLLSHGYEPTVSCAFRAARWAYSPILTLQHLQRHGVRMTPYVLSLSILLTDTASTEWLLSLRLDLNEEAKPEGHHDVAFHRTALQAAAERGNLALLDKLVDLGADINAPAYHRSGTTALQVAAIKGYFTLVRRLLVLGADPNAAGAELSGRTALEGAAEHGRLDIVQLLLNSGVETNGPGRRQFVRAIAFAKHEGHAAVATLLRSHRPWTEADQDISNEDSLLHEDQTSQKEADHQSASLDQNVEDGKEPQLDAANCDPPQLFGEPMPSLSDEPSESFGRADRDRSIGFVTERDDQTHSDESYIESDMESLGVIRGEAELVDIPGTQESLGEAENAFWPSGIFDQVKKDLESTGEGDGIWTEAYDAFSLEIIY